MGDLAALDERTVDERARSGLGHAPARPVDGASTTDGVEVERDPKSIGHEETYPHDLYEHPELERELVRLSDAVAGRLRKHGIGARTLTLKLRFAGFRTITRSTTVPGAVSTGPEIVAALRPILRDVDVSPGVRLLGVSTGNFAAPSQQLSLLGEPDLPAEPDKTASAIDEIRDRFGNASIGPASSIRRGRMDVVRKGAQQWGPDHGPGQGPDRRTDEGPNRGRNSPGESDGAR